MRGAGISVLLAGLSVFPAAGCGPTVDLAKALQIEVISTGWLDAGIVDGKNKLVPSITFKLKNVSDQKLPMLQINAVFRRVGETGGWGDRLITVAGSSGFVPGATTEAFTINSPLGYTGAEPRLDMFNNSHFVDAKVDLFAKYGSTQWTRSGEYPIARQLIER